MLEETWVKEEIAVRFCAPVYRLTAPPSVDETLDLLVLYTA
jgi:hypothetical protein